MSFLDFLKLKNNSVNNVDTEFLQSDLVSKEENFSLFDCQTDDENFETDNLTLNNLKPNNIEETALNKETIANIQSNAKIPLGDGSTINVNDYINNILSQQVGFETEQEYQEFVLDKFTSYLEQMKATYQEQEDDNGFFSNLYDGAKELFGLGTSSKDVEDSLEKYEQMVQGLTDAINGESDISFEQVYEYYTGTTFSTEKTDKYIETSNLYSAVMVGCQYDSKYIENFEKETGTSVNEIIEDYAQCQLDTFGDVSEVKNIIEEYSQDQQTYADKLSSIVSTAGLACTVVGAITTFFCPPAGMALLSAGKGIALSGMFIDNAIDLVDNATDGDGLTKDEIKDLALETGVETVSYAAGRGIGKLTNNLNSVVSSKVAEAGANNVVSYIAGQTAETVTDTALSLGADYAIAQGQSLITTGELMNSEDYWSLDRFLGEGKNQLIGILTGLSSAKVSAYQQGIIKTAQGKIIEGDIEGAKTYLKEKGMKMDDTSFEGFVKNVQEVEQLKLQNEGDIKQVETAESETQKLVESTETQKNIEVDESVKNAEVKTDNSETITKKIGLQFFAEKANEDTAIDYSKLTYDEKVDLLKEAGLSDYKIEKFAMMEGAQFDNAVKLVKAGFDEYFIEFFSIDDVLCNNAIKLKEAGLDDITINIFVDLEGTQFDNAVKLIKAGVRDNEYIKELATDNNICNNVITLKNAGFDDYYIKDLAMDDNKYNDALKMKEEGYAIEIIPVLADFEKNGTEFKNALKLFEAGIDSRYIKDLVTDDNICNNAITLKNAGVFDIYIKQLATDDNVCKNALTLKNAGVNDNRYIKDLATDLNEKQINNALTLKNAGVDDLYIKQLATDLNEKQINNAITLKNAGVDDYYIKQLATDDNVCKNAITLKNAGVDDDYIKQLATDDNLCQNAITLKNAGVDDRYIKYLATDDNKCNSMLKYINMGIEGSKALELINNGIDLFSKLDLVEVSKEAQSNMFKNFFANNSNVDEIIKNTDFSQYGKEGIPLEYSRTEFLGDLSSELSKLPTETQTEIIEKLGIEVIQDENGNITGYDGIIDLTKLSSDGEEGKVLELANNFILNNKVVTGDSEVDNALNSLISGMPEFINTIGKQQHNTHSYSLDTHILETYKATISDSDYESLSDYQKFELKLMTILHDISKGENVVDDNHPLVSAKYAKDILSRYSLSDNVQYDIVNNILNHHWGKDYNTQAVFTEETAVQMGTTSNYEIQKIFAKADLSGMGNSEFFADKLEGLSDSSQENLVNTINKAKETTPLVYTTPIIKPDLIPSQEITLLDGTTKTIRSLNLATLPDDYDMEEYGFLPKTKAKDVTLGVHTANSQSQFDLFEMLTSDPIASSPQSVSIVSKNDNALFKRFGIALNLKASDVINATHYDQGCGTAKTGNELIDLATGGCEYEAWREILPNKVQEKLGISPSEYSELASIMEDYKYLTQINDSKEITVGEKTFTGSEIKSAISTAQGELMQMATSRSSVNDGFHSTGDITELVVKHAEVIDNTYVLRYDSADDINNENILTSERKALNTFLADIPENSTVIFAGYDGYLYSSKANQWKVSQKTSVKEDVSNIE